MLFYSGHGGILMVVNIERLFSKRSTRMKASEIRELLKLTQIPDQLKIKIYQVL